MTKFTALHLLQEFAHLNFQNRYSLETVCQMFVVEPEGARGAEMGVRWERWRLRGRKSRRSNETVHNRKRRLESSRRAEDTSGQATTKVNPIQRASKTHKPENRDHVSPLYQKENSLNSKNKEVVTATRLPLFKRSQMASDNLMSPTEIGMIA